MADLWQTTAELCLELHPDRVNAIIGGIDKINSVDQLPLVRECFGPKAGHDFFIKLQTAWRARRSVSSAEIVAALKSALASAIQQRTRGAVELVWSGPATEIVPVRQTEEVLCEVIESAQVRLFLVSYVAHKLERVLRCMEAASARGVDICVLLEPSIENGGRLNADFVTPLARRLPRAGFYQWKDADNASVHAKCAVADGKVAFITSANLTAAAMDRNMELGVLMKGGYVPEQLQQHLGALIDNETIDRI
ncbi:cardiolipin synthase [Ereboglobus sp. PH5-10]|uniref:DISARM system phospholipase D-like protein DrmC n=1 Tax=Ereboglobus sp. PH5-10 TaxID=2940629 RepID=UPI0024077480|nr:DISARM system phospholipase D-like protein DrmC [Ereboglobus sp. PH5-10]MDF9828604.1 cardiolipin synthase [Ereboglobus sp. PH5-10]